MDEFPRHLAALLAALLAACGAYFLVQYLVVNSGRFTTAIRENPIPIIIAACVLLLVYYGVEGTLVGATIHEQLVSIIVQFLFLIVLGGAVTALYQARLQLRASEQRRVAERAEITERDRQTLRAMHDDLVSAYNKAKRARRLLCARLEYPAGEAGPASVDRSVYDEQMEALVDAELDFESILRRIASNVSLFGRNSRLDGLLDELGEHLTETVYEYRQELPRFDAEAPLRRLDELPRLEAFLGLSPSGEATGGGPDDASKRRFREHFDEAIHYLRVEINKRARRINQTGCILWVDDQPANNRYEIDQLSENGYQVTQAKSTKGAVRHVKGGLKPMVVISDMVRVEGGTKNSQAGIELLKALRDLQEGKSIPVCFYTSFETMEKFREEVAAEGGMGITDSRLSLFRFIDDRAKLVEQGEQ